MTAPALEGTAADFVDGWAPMGMSLVGNAFSLAAPVQIHGQLVELDTRIASRAELLAAAPIPTMPGVLPRHGRKVFEVAGGADAASIQAAIDAAAKLAGADPGAWPVVHLAHGRYPLEQTVTIPTGARIQLAGDGCYTWGDGPKGTVLVWADEQAPGPALLIQGPAQARLRDFGILTPEPWRRSDEKLRTPGMAGLSGPVAPNLVAGIVAQGIDQPGGRVHLQECNPNGLFGAGTLVEGLDRTFVQIIACEGTGLEGGWNRTWDGQLLFLGAGSDEGSPPPAAGGGASLIDLNRRIGKVFQANPAVLRASGEIVRPVTVPLGTVRSKDDLPALGYCRRGICGRPCDG